MFLRVSVGERCYVIPGYVGVWSTHMRPWECETARLKYDSLIYVIILKILNQVSSTSQRYKRDWRQCYDFWAYSFHTSINIPCNTQMLEACSVRLNIIILLWYTQSIYIYTLSIYIYISCISYIYMCKYHIYIYIYIYIYISSSQYKK